MLKIYRDKDGYTFQYEEGTQPEGLELVEQPEGLELVEQPEGLELVEQKAKQRKPANKARTTRTKKAEK